MMFQIGMIDLPAGLARLGENLPKAGDDQNDDREVDDR